MDLQRDELSELIVRLGDDDPRPRHDEPVFIFYSEARFRRDCKIACRRHRDVEGDFYLTSDGKEVRGNYMGSLIDGYPGCIVDGLVIRPPNYKSYKLLGEQIPAGQTPAKGQVTFVVSPHRPKSRYEEILLYAVEAHIAPVRRDPSTIGASVNHSLA